MKGKAAITQPNDRTMRIAEYEVPEPGPDEVLVQVTLACICGSDLHMWRGEVPWFQPAPGIQGHEMTGRIARLGANRGHDSLAIFAVDDSSGTLGPVGWEPTQGKTPRFFAIEPSGTVLYAANMDSDTIVAFRVDAGSGKLTPTGQIIKTGSPSSIVFR